MAKMNTPYIPHGKNYHFFIGTSGIISMHVMQPIELGEKLIIGGQEILVTSIKVSQPSTYYEGFLFYQLTFTKKPN